MNVEDEGQEDQAIEETLEEERYEDELKNRLETSTEFGQFLITPTKALKKSIYHKFIQKDMAVSNLPKGDTWVFFLMRYQQLIDNLIFLALDGEKNIIDQKTGKTITIPKFNPIIEVATVYDTEKLGFLELMRSVGGFEREKLTTVTHVRKDVNRQDQQQGWFKRGGQQ